MNSQNAAVKKIENKKAFTLAEALVAILIMLMVSSIMVAGIPAARSAYENVVWVSNAEILRSTAISALRNELGMSTNIDILKDGSDKGVGVTYYNTTYGCMSKIFKHVSEGENDPDPDGTIMLQRYASVDVDGIGSVDTGGTEGGVLRLVSKEASNNDLYVTYDSVSLNNKRNVITFVGLKVYHEKDGRLLSPQGSDAADSVSIRLMANE